MATEVWVRNPAAVIREATEAGMRHFIWDGGFLARRGLDPIEYIDANWHNMTGTHRTIVLGDGAAHEYSNKGELWHPNAVYPQWRYGEDLDKLEKFVLDPVVNRPDDLSWQDNLWMPEMRPVEGQEHRVVVSNLPATNNPLVRQFLGILLEIQEENPDCIIHLHGLYAYRVMFGMGFAATDMDARTDAAHGVVRLPSGRKIQHTEARKHENWVNLLGFRSSDLKVPRNRCIFNLKSAQWAGKYFMENVRFVTKRREGDSFDPDDPFSDPLEDDEIMMRRGVRAKKADKWICDNCSLQNTCKLYREGAVCAVPDSEPIELVQFAGTRDSETIIDRLGHLLAAQETRLNKAMQDEAVAGKLDPEVTKLVAMIFDRGVKLAKLVNPALAAPKLQFTLNQNKNVIEASNPQQLMAAVTQELAARGIPMSAITPEMVMAVIAVPEEQRGHMIEAQVQAARGLGSGA